MTNTNRKYRRLSWTDPEAWGADGILKDGVAVSVPLSLADASMAEVAGAARAVRSGAYNRPGWRTMHQDAAARDALQQARDDYELELTLAWTGKPNADPDDDKVDSNGSTAAGTVITQAFTLPDAAMTMDEIYAAYDRAAENAWKTGKGKTPVRARGDGTPPTTTKDEAYQKYDQELEAAYRNPPTE
jgi:hypothetical protein